MLSFPIDVFHLSFNFLAVVTLDIYLSGCAYAPVKSHGCALLLISKPGARAWDESSRKLFAYSRSGGRLTQSFLVNETEEPAEEMLILYVKQTEIFSMQTSGYAGIANISLLTLRGTEHASGKEKGKSGKSLTFFTVHRRQCRGI
jgi:hypothetical protein